MVKLLLRLMVTAKMHDCSQCNVWSMYGLAMADARSSYGRWTVELWPMCDWYYVGLMLSLDVGLTELRSPVVI